MISLIFVIISLMTLMLSSSFIIKSNKMIKSFISMVKPGSYQERLEQARLAKLQKSSGEIKPVVTSNNSQRPTANSPTTAAASAKTPVISLDNNLPFADEIYDHLKYVTTKLSARIKGTTPLSFDELNKLKESVNMIIEDSYGDIRQSNLKPEVKEITKNISNNPLSAPPTDKTKTNQSYKQLSDAEKNTFAEYFKGESSWKVPGMEKMTTEEYYDAVNKRLEEILEKTVELMIEKCQQVILNH